MQEHTQVKFCVRMQPCTRNSPSESMCHCCTVTAKGCYTKENKRTKEEDSLKASCGAFNDVA